jgi:hypothetical protein
MAAILGQIGTAAPTLAPTLLSVAAGNLGAVERLRNQVGLVEDILFGQVRDEVPAYGPPPTIEQALNGTSQVLDGLLARMADIIVRLK